MIYYCIILETIGAALVASHPRANLFPANHVRLNMTSARCLILQRLSDSRYSLPITAFPMAGLRLPNNSCG